MFQKAIALSTITLPPKCCRDVLLIPDSVERSLAKSLKLKATERICYSIINALDVYSPLTKYCTCIVTKASVLISCITRLDLEVLLSIIDTRASLFVRNKNKLYEEPQINIPINIGTSSRHLTSRMTSAFFH
jgi:hypothetical protein